MHIESALKTRHRCLHSVHYTCMTLDVVRMQWEFVLGNPSEIAQLETMPWMSPEHPPHGRLVHWMHAHTMQNNEAQALTNKICLNRVRAHHAECKVLELQTTCLHTKLYLHNGLTYVTEKNRTRASFTEWWHYTRGRPHLHAWYLHSTNGS